MLTVSVVIATIAGREAELDRTIRVYEERTPVKIEWVIEHDHPNVGAGWNAGAARAAGDILHLSNDDIEPETDGWLAAAESVLELGGVPVGLIREDEAGAFGRDFCRIPTCLREWWTPLPEIHYYCVPTDHRALTRRGWRHHHELVLGEPILVLDPGTHELRWEPLMGINVQPYAGPLDVVERKGDRWEFTPNHRWPIERMQTRHRCRYRRVVGAGDLKAGDRLPIRGDFRGAESCLSPRLAAILGWVLGDGSYFRDKRGYSRMVVYQSERKFLPEAVAAVGREPSTAVIGRDVRTIYVKPEDRKAIEVVCASKADAPRVAARLSRTAAEAMMGALIMAEGSRTRAGGRVVNQSPSANPAICEAIQILALLTGTNASISQTSTAMYLKSSAGIDVAGALSRRACHYEGDVWCPRTPSGTWVMEHDGSAIPTGNSDNAFTDLMHVINHPAMVAEGFDFYHRRSMVGRDETPERVARDRDTYLSELPR